MIKGQRGTAVHPKLSSVERVEVLDDDPRAPVVRVIERGAITKLDVGTQFAPLSGSFVADQHASSDLVYSERLGYVSVPENECPETNEYVSECTCSYHINQRQTSR